MDAASPLASSTTSRRSWLDGGEWDLDQDALRFHQGQLGDGDAHPGGLRAARPLGCDVAGVAQTGYAKTNAFGLSYAVRMLPIVNEVDVASWLTVVLGERGMNQARERLMRQSTGRRRARRGPS
jgi:hypothetical protein